MMPPVGSSQSPAAPPASRDEVAADSRGPRGSLANQMGPSYQAASLKGSSPGTPGLLGIQSILGNLQGERFWKSPAWGLYTSVFFRVTKALNSVCMVEMAGTFDPLETLCLLDL